MSPDSLTGRASRAMVLSTWIALVVPAAAAEDNEVPRPAGASGMHDNIFPMTHTNLTRMSQLEINQT